MHALLLPLFLALTPPAPKEEVCSLVEASVQEFGQQAQALTVRFCSAGKTSLLRLQTSLLQPKLQLLTSLDDMIAVHPLQLIQVRPGVYEADLSRITAAYIGRSNRVSVVVGQAGHQPASLNLTAQALQNTKDVLALTKY